MFNFFTASLTAAIILGGVAAASAAPPRTFQDQSGAWHVQDQSGEWHRASRAQRSMIAVPPVDVLPFSFQEQQRLDVAKGNIG